MASVELKAKIDEWLKWDKNASTRSEIEQLNASGNYAELEKRLLTRMEFGTAGLRARMGAGYSMMNDLTIVQTTQGFFSYLNSHFGTETLRQRGVILGFDGRHNSKQFAQLAARVFVTNNVPVYLFRQITPTPFVPYGILKLKCVAGVMVTASHNPKDDNGYKVYFDNGAQIISPHDKGIANAIELNLEPNANAWEIEGIEKNTLVTDPFDQILDGYFSDLKSFHFCSDDENANSSLKFVYTAMHGVGYDFSKRAFKDFALKDFIPVKEQVAPDADFPTVKFPNPEEGKSALDLAIRTANENGATVILANDPDADRFALAEKRKDTGEWKIFTGNEIAALLGWWIWQNFKAKDNGKTPASDVYMLYSTVSSHILRSMAEKEGFKCEDTLTGFKWMGNRAHELEHKEHKRVIFSFEEAIGFMCGTRVLDKDGISAEICAAEMASYLARVENRTCIEKLDWIYETYGYHVSNNSYYLCYEQENIVKMFTKLRHFNNNSQGEDYTYPDKCGPYKINKIRDLTVGLQIDLTTGSKSVPNFPSSKSSQMITFYFENGCVLTIRTSGTEPKVKWYSEMKQLDPKKSRDDIRNELDDLVKHMIDEFYQPGVNNMKPRTT